MALVTYSDSDGSEDEQATASRLEAGTKASASNFSIDKSNPGKIRVSLQRPASSAAATENTHNDEPIAKRPRIGGGAFSGFNSILPTPKGPQKTNPPSDGASKAPARKVFSLKTGAEPSFSRESDDQLRNLFAEQNHGQDSSKQSKSSISLPIPPFAKPPPVPVNSIPSSFKPLSVTQNQRNKKKAVGTLQRQVIKGKPQASAAEAGGMATSSDAIPFKKKVNLFSSGAENIVSLPEPEDEDMDAPQEGLGTTSVRELELENTESFGAAAVANSSHSQSLDSIAADLNLTAIQRRQLFGRSNSAKSSAAPSAINIVNFNTDEEYAHNQTLIAAGETMQHNPVRAIAPGKHSLRQLVNAASTQKEALEESFAEGRRNKREAGNKYGW